eukprot:gnl/TRDRNA2_/TRDRNA2_127290_c1_seq2.p2 gnl/TRDRNA2_/TRDRNA2_127290_c1~~gnl/TRDRNA2_/TRDRNA2_127290_c1_seq2.p2  ORF type:complete len:222 (-),score=11.89 gnl/TRDRNA2_/TRDRNA2_127290_c1_seq2:214-879(-)
MLFLRTGPGEECSMPVDTVGEPAITLATAGLTAVAAIPSLVLRGSGERPRLGEPLVDPVLYTCRCGLRLRVRSAGLAAGFGHAACKVVASPVVTLLIGRGGDGEGEGERTNEANPPGAITMARSCKRLWLITCIGGLVAACICKAFDCGCDVLGTSMAKPGATTRGGLGVAVRSARGANSPVPATDRLVLGCVVVVRQSPEKCGVDSHSAHGAQEVPGVHR